MTRLRHIIYTLPILLTACAPPHTTTLHNTATTHTTTRHITQDSLIIQDSIILYHLTDTIRLREVHYRTHYTHTHDTITRHDTIHTEIPVTVEVIRETHRLLWWQKSLAYIGAIALLFALYRLARLLHHP